ncbi:Gfo/Idh/MocA family oxidoreductase [Nakamurella flavida]|uniref:Gfo/Idh/MocA family oxidoreductase n=1 Tax=Nakamurella flavida TaxID=363630 RepID=A0A938YJL9_9ACTN|nr:Gfo/Idh/MocA family oxidoreductase [Nakamurella flavida]MBM9477187.1 Gfo/Idh/MocA family oxidoreductase [Nakamurella flavida]MDP9780136.1 putative dehydrogenase [Nakamurella flavida]
MSLPTPGSTSIPTRRPLPVAVAGFGWMGRAHTQAYARVLHHFPDLPVAPVLAAVADEVPGRAAAAADQFGFARAELGWPALVADPDIAAISVTAPNFLHREIGVAVVSAGKHLWIEKPVGLSADDARAVADAARRAGVRTAVGFNYRNAPAVQATRDLIAAGGIGRVTHASFRLLSDYAAHPQGALTWRYERERGGNGVLGDLMSHGVDLVRHLLGDLQAVVADTAVFVPQRSRPTGATSGHGRAEGGELGDVQNDDWAGGLMRMASGARVGVEASRVAVGQQNTYGFEIHGTAGMVAWDFRRMGELRLSTGDRYQDEPAATVFVGPDAGAYGAFQPGAGIAMGYDDLKVIEAAAFLRSIADGEPHGATIDDAVAAAQALDAMTESVASGRWVTLS